MTAYRNHGCMICEDRKKEALEWEDKARAAEKRVREYETSNRELQEDLRSRDEELGEFRHQVLDLEDKNKHLKRQAGWWMSILVGSAFAGLVAGSLLLATNINSCQERGDLEDAVFHAQDFYWDNNLSLDKVECVELFDAHWQCTNGAEVVRCYESVCKRHPPRPNVVEAEEG